MDKRLITAIKEFEKAQKEHTTAIEKAKAASEAARKAWDEVKSFKNRDIDPNYEAAKAASKAEKEARNAEKLTTAVLYAVSNNVVQIAANILRDAIEANYKNLDKPAHYKAFNAAFTEILGNDFYFDASWSSFYVCYRRGSYGYNQSFVCDLDSEKKFKPERLKEYTSPRNRETTLKEIKKEVKKAQKDAANIYKKYEKLYLEYNKIESEYNTYIRHFLPSIDKYGVKDEKKFFN